MSNIDKHAVQAVADLKAGYTLGHADVAILNELARIALASLEAEPVLYAAEETLVYSKHGELHLTCLSEPMGDAVIPLYTAPPAPVSVPAGYRLQPISEYGAMCAAMLHGAEPVSQHPELTVWYGSMPETNGKANWTAILHRKGEGIQDGMTIDRSEYPDRVLYAADRVRYLIGEKSDRPCILDYDSDAHSGYVKPGNCPVVPDGWVACSERMPEETGDIIVVSDGIVMSGISYSRKKGFYLQALEYDADESVDDVTHWMPLPAAPQQEVKP